MTNAENVSLKMAMELARHSDPKLTFATYSHLRIEESASPLDNLPGVLPEVIVEEPSLRKTGTCDAVESKEHPQQIPQQLQHDSVQNGASACTSEDVDHAHSSDTSDEHNDGENAELCNAVQDDAAEKQWWARQDSNLRPMDYESTGAIRNA